MENEVQNANDIIDLDKAEEQVEVEIKAMNNNSNKKAIILVSAILSLILIAGVSYFIFGANNTSEVNEGDVKDTGTDKNATNISGTGAEQFFGEGDKIYPSPINGVMHTQEQYNIFSIRRPLAVMINNHIDARPQHGVSYADIVYEVVAEGGITRWIAIFHSQGAGQVGPIRSARVYYASLAAGYNPFFAHWGGAYVNPSDPENTTNPEADVYDYMNGIGLPSLDQAYVGGKAYYRDNSRGVALEHTGYADTDKLWSLPGSGDPAIYPEPAWKEYVDFASWNFKDVVVEDLRPETATIGFNFWDVPDFAVKYDYNKSSNTWDRTQGGAATVDLGNNNKRISPKVVIVMFATERSANDKKAHLFYDVIGSGTASIFQDGKQVNGTWVKRSATSREVFYDNLGNPMSFDRGQIWVEVLPAGNTVSFVAL